MFTGLPALAGFTVGRPALGNAMRLLFTPGCAGPGVLEAVGGLMARAQGSVPTWSKSTSTEARSLGGITNVPTGPEDVVGAVAIRKWIPSPTRSATEGDGLVVSLRVTAATTWPVLAT